VCQASAKSVGGSPDSEGASVKTRVGTLEAKINAAAACEEINKEMDGLQGKIRRMSSSLKDLGGNLEDAGN